MKLLETDLEKKTGMHIIIDYFSATFPFLCYEEDSEYGIINEIILMCCDFLISIERMLKSVILM